MTGNEMKAIAINSVIDGLESMRKAIAGESKPNFFGMVRDTNPETIARDLGIYVARLREIEAADWDAEAAREYL